MATKSLYFTNTRKSENLTHIKKVVEKSIYTKPLESYNKTQANFSTLLPSEYEIEKKIEEEIYRGRGGR